MFENCRLWNQKLDDRDEGLLPFDEWGALEDHLAHCTGCSQRLRANSAFRVEVETSVSDLSAEASNQFDDAVLSQINTEELAATVELKPRINFGGWLKDQLHRSTFSFLGQLVGGALLAACVTAFCLSIAIHPAYQTHETTRMLQDFLPLSAVTSSHPVPMESLLVTPSPKAAMLWSKTPPIPYTEQEVTPSSHIPTSPKTTLPNRHGSLQSTDHIG